MLSRCLLCIEPFSLAYILAHSNFSFLFCECSSFGADGERLHLRDQILTLRFSTDLHHRIVHLVQVDLLRSKNTSRSHDSNPSDESSWRESVVLHDVERDEGAGPPEAGFAVDGDCAFLLFGGRQEFLYDGVFGASAVGELQVQERDAAFLEDFLVVLRLVETDDEGDAELLEDGHVVLRGERSVLVGHWDGAGERDEFSGYCPVEISVFNFLVVLVFLHVEVVVVVPAETHADLETFEAMVDCAFVVAWPADGVAERYKLILNGAEHRPGFFRTLFEADNHVTTHEESCVGFLFVVYRSIMINLVILVRLIRHEFFQLFAE